MKKLLLMLALSGLVILSMAQKKITPPAPFGAIPSENQLAWHKLEKYAFVHFTTNTFTDKEWGYGDESEKIFNPTSINVDQWVSTIKEAGLKGLIFTCKHHDGFCLWPSKFTEHSVKNSLYKNGEGDIVKEVADACRKYGIKFGIYLSPWDRNRTDYGQPSYVEYYRNQLKELFTNYGPVFEMWFDGANGGDGYYGGKRDSRKIDASRYYDWPNTIAMVKNLDPKVVFFSDAGPDIRWCANEKGYIGETNWCTISTDTLYAGKPDILTLLNAGTEDGKKWVPAEVDVSIRPGWFYHKNEDTKVRTPENLLDIYLSSVGRGANLILNIPPDRRGLINENDQKALKGWKKLMDETFKTNLALHARVTASSYRGRSRQFTAGNVTDGNPNTYWTTDDKQKSGDLEINLGKKKNVKYILLQEYIELGQRIRSFKIEAYQNGQWKQIANATTIGYKRIVSVPNIQTSKIRIVITDSKACPVISTIEVY